MTFKLPSLKGKFNADKSLVCYGLPPFQWANLRESGSFGLVFVARNGHGEKVVIKKLLSEDDQAKRLFIKEAKSWKFSAALTVNMSSNWKLHAWNHVQWCLNICFLTSLLPAFLSSLILGPGDKTCVMQAGSLAWIGHRGQRWGSRNRELARRIAWFHTVEAEVQVCKLWD